MSPRFFGLGFVLFITSSVFAAGPTLPLAFEDVLGLSDRVIVGSMQGPADGTVMLRNGSTLPLGQFINGHVFTRYRITVTECSYDAENICVPGETEIMVPGGAVWQSVNGESRLIVWEIAGGATMPLSGKSTVVLFLVKHPSGTYHLLNDASARPAVDRSSGTPRVTLRFASPRLLSPEGRERIRGHLAHQNPATQRPVFIEQVPLDRLKRLIDDARAFRTVR